MKHVHLDNKEKHLTYLDYQKEEVAEQKRYEEETGEQLTEEDIKMLQYNERWLNRMLNI